MKLLFDENLSRKLVARFAGLFPNSTRVAFEGLLRQPDPEVWQFAKARGFAVVGAAAGNLAYPPASPAGSPS